MLGSMKRWILRCLPPTWAGWLRTWRVRRMIRRFPTRVVEHRYSGHRLKVFLADPLSQGWYDHDWPDLPEIHALRQGKLRTGARIFDIGAHQGVVASILAREVGVSGLVVAVEASPHNCIAAEKNVELNGLTQVKVIRAAVSDRPGSLLFNEGLNGQIDDGSGSGGTLEVDALTIDGLADDFGQPDVVFLDIEGAECLALSGGSKVLASPADFFVEVHVGYGLEKLGGSVAKVLSYFPENLYSLQIRAESDRTFRPLQANDPLTKDRFFLIALRRDLKLS